MTIQCKEHLIVVLDKLVPDFLTVFGEFGFSSISRDNLMCRENGRYMSMAFEHTLGPFKRAVGHAPIKSKNEPFTSTGLENMIIVVACRRSATPRANLVEALRIERFQIRCFATLICGAGINVMITCKNAVFSPSLIKVVKYFSGLVEFLL